MSDIIKQLNQLQADSHALFIKFHDYHWNVRGLHFFGVHEYTEKAYNQMAELFDELAERTLQLGGKAITCQKALLETAKCPKLNQESYSARDVASAMRESYSYLKNEFLKLRKLADAADDFGTVTLAEENVVQLEKALWMLNYSLDCADTPAQ